VTPRWWTIEGKWHFAAADTLWNPTHTQADLHQVIGALAWTLPVLRRTLRLGGGLGWDLGTQQVVSPQAHATYTHPTGCLRIALTARWDPDRTLPDVAMQFRLTAGNRTTR
jgi:hypothetical protein